MARARVSDAAERTLDAWLTGLMEGKIRIQDLPLCVSAWFHAGEAYGRASRDLEVQQLERDVNRWYYLAITTPTQRRDHIERRLSQALEHATVEQWDQLDQDLAVMAGQPINNVHSIRADPASAETGVNDGSSAAPERRGRPAA